SIGWVVNDGHATRFRRCRRAGAGHFAHPRGMPFCGNAVERVPGAGGWRRSVEPGAEAERTDAGFLDVRWGRYPARQDGDPGAERHAIVKVDDVLVEQPDAARRHSAPDRRRIAGTVNAVQRVAPVLIEVEGARTEGVLGTARHAAVGEPG